MGCKPCRRDMASVWQLCIRATGSAPLRGVPLRMAWLDSLIKEAWARPDRRRNKTRVAALATNGWDMALA